MIKKGGTMHVRAVILITVIVFASGCTMMGRQTAKTDNTQYKVAQLEKKLEDRDRKIAELEYELRGMANHVEDLESRSRESETRSSSTRTTSSSTTLTKVENNRIIRVPVSAKEVQNALSNAGYYAGKIDGKIGSGSKKAIFEFQKDHDLVSDGIIGKKTWSQLKNYLD